MRGIRALALALAVGSAVLASGPPAEEPDGVVHGLVGPHLPDALTIETGYGARASSYQIGRDGRVRRIAGAPSPSSLREAFGSTPGVWWAVHGRRLVVGRGAAIVWRSHGEFPSLLSIRMVQVSSRAVAFSYGDGLYLAPLDGPEQLVARKEFPLGFTNGGLYTSGSGRRLLLRSDTGAVVKTIVRRPLQWDYFVLNGSLYFIEGSSLMRARGVSVQQLASLRNRRLAARSLSMQPLGTLLELEDQHRLVLLRQDGSLFARTLLRGSSYRAENEVNVYAVVSARAVAFIVAPGQTSGPEMVYVLQAGGRRAISVYQRRVHLSGCARWVTLQWEGRWLLYNDVVGHLAVIDTVGARRAIELGSMVRRLPGARDGFRAYWTQT